MNKKMKHAVHKFILLAYFVGKESTKNIVGKSECYPFDLNK